ncbi:helix-turn-helix domain-containing protein (plasmid) [Mycobacterium sp. SMC-8]|uniref:helix-turn-helix domain-containing protein n=1 Tax=Mycobacterium sp. SMC-8 TaxID=2857060 RepID=UPI0021B162AF|nr:helix-turn-helix domain-containing protein [Mycobacterium sp. SMC-8]UXA15850.1 helix-turn-helix domain-containing protein [Mycobacterium sp. SMC-8]
MEANEQQAVGQRLRSARETLGLTQEDVAGALGIQRTSVIAMEAGKRGVGALELRRLARLYRRSVGWVLGEEPDPDIASDDDHALYRATAELSPDDKAQVLRFAQFLAAGSSPPDTPGGRTGITERRRPKSPQAD